ncbi:hypothetical protein [Amycolatopsis plumensis]|uniref:Secreted protein n=1 Tax=Amycolatopsis plumensis TaxID=236508 RepID=A0ABV5TZN4_9PSEU
MPKIRRPVAAVLCAGGLAVATPEAAAAPRAAAASVAAAPGHCLSGIRKVQVTSRYTPSHRLYVVHSAWIPFPTSPCLKTR